jgi:hypothetical protein
VEEAGKQSSWTGGVVVARGSARVAPGRSDAGGDVVSLCARWGRSGWATDKERASPRSMGGEKAVEMDVDRSLTA